jgi:hypothetical protein
MKMRLVGLLAGCLAMFGMSEVGATTYNVDISYVDIVTGFNSVTGTIATDGNAGNLLPADIIDWNLVVKVGSATSSLLGPLSGNNSQFGCNAFGCALVATPAALTFDISMFFEGFGFGSNPAPPGPYWTAATLVGSPFSQWNTENNPSGAFLALTGNLVFPVAADATPLPAALPLFAGGLGVIGLLARRRKQKAL